MGSPGAWWAPRSRAEFEGLMDVDKPRAAVQGTFWVVCPSPESSLFEEKMVLGERSPQPLPRAERGSAPGANPTPCSPGHRPDLGAPTVLQPHTSGTAALSPGLSVGCAPPAGTPERGDLCQQAAGLGVQAARGALEVQGLGAEQAGLQSWPLSR